MGGRPLAWLVRAWVAGLLIPVGGDAPLPRAHRLTSVGTRGADSMLVGITASAPTRRLAAEQSTRAKPRSSEAPTRATLRAAKTPTRPTQQSFHAGPTEARAVLPDLSSARLASAPGNQDVEHVEPPTQVPSHVKRSTRSPSTPHCEGDLWLAGSVVNDARPRLSLAMVRRSAGTAVVSPGGRVDDFTVLAIEPTRARLRASNGSECTLSEVPPGPRPVVVAAPPPVSPAPEPGDKPPPGKAMFLSGELARGVRVLGPRSYAVARSLVLKALGNPGGAAGGAWFRLAERDGQRIGMEVRAVRDGTPLSAMGMRTGDVARSVNGIALDTPAGLVEALRAARESDAITISIQRDGQASDMRYTIE